MELEDLRGLPLDDQVTMLVGISVRHAVELESALRSVLMALDPDFDASTRRTFTSLLKMFRKLTSTDTRFTSEVRSACESIAAAVQAAYNRRSHNVHHMLIAYSDTSVERFRFERDYEISLHREPELLFADDLVEHCIELMHATWRLRGVSFYIQRPEARKRWEMLLSGQFDARWNGSAGRTWTETARGGGFRFKSNYRPLPQR